MMKSQTDSLQPTPAASRPRSPAPLFGETIRQSGLLFSAQSVSMALNFLVTLALLHWIDSNEMGRLAFSLSVIVLTNLFFELGVFAAGARVLALARDRHDERRALGALVILAACLGVALALFLVAAAAPIDVFFRIDVRWILIPAAALAFFQPFQLMIELSCQGLNRIRQLAGFQLLTTGTYLLALLGLGFTGRLSAKSALLAYLGATGLAAIVTLAQLRPDFHAPSAYIRQTIKEARGYGLNLYLARITGTASVRLDSFVIKYFIASPAPLGLYDRAQKLANPISNLSRALAITRFRAFASVERVPGRITKWNAVILISTALLTATAGPFLLREFFPKYADAAPLLIPFALYNLFAGLFQPYNAFLAARGHSAALRNIALTITVASVTGLLVAVPLFGIRGAAWAGAATMLLDYLLHLYYYRKSLGSLESLESPESLESGTQSIERLQIEDRKFMSKARAEKANQVTDSQVMDTRGEASVRLQNSPNSQDSPDFLDSLDSLDYKTLAREQWSANPCGAHVAKDFEFGTRDYFDAIEDYRYRVYSPWMKETLGFDQYAGKRLLEVGCGTGTDLLQFARGGALVTGIDLTPRSIEIARRRFSVYGMGGDFLVSDAEKLDFPDESFDVVYSFGVIHHTPDTVGAVREIRRVLKPGGRAIVMVYHRASLYYWGGIILKRGVLGGELLRASAAELMSRYVEHTETGGRPLVKAYTRREARALFSEFSDCRVEVNQLTREELRWLGKTMPETLFAWLARNFGWNLIITATK